MLLLPAKTRPGGRSSKLQFHGRQRNIQVHLSPSTTCQEKENDAYEDRTAVGEANAERAIEDIEAKPIEEF